MREVVKAVDGQADRGCNRRDMKSGTSEDDKGWMHVERDGEQSVISNEVKGACRSTVVPKVVVLTFSTPRSSFTSTQSSLLSSRSLTPFSRLAVNASMASRYLYANSSKM